MSEQTVSRPAEISAPEPGLTAETIVARAKALIPAIREQADEAERIGHHTAELDAKFTEAGFYRMLQPKRFGGYAFGMDTFWRVIMAVAEGDAGTAWGLCLGAHHAPGVGAWFPERGQIELFGPTGNFKCPHRAAPMGTATPVDGGYVVKGQWDYCSGVGHATHFMGNTLIPGRESDGVLTVCTPIENVTVIPDWGDGNIIGMNSSGSNSVRVENVFVPEYCTCSGDWTHNTDRAAPGMALHDDPLFCGRIYAMYHAGLVIPVIGAARGALHEFEQILLTKQTYFRPIVPRYTVEEYQRHYGQARALIDSAEAIIMQCGERYMRLAERWHRTGEPFSREDDAAMSAMIQVAAQLLAARDGFTAGKIDAAALTAVEDVAIRDAVKLQESAGLQSATDGEFRRGQWHADFMYAIPGIDRGALGAPLPVYTKDGQISWTPNVTEITGKVHLETPIFGDHFRFLAQTVTTAIPKITVPSPSMAHFRVDLSKSPYTGYEEFRADVAATYAAEVAAPYALGCRYLQFDDTIFAFLNDPAWRANANATGIDPDRQHEINVDVINTALADKPADLAVTVHMCRGNYRSAWFSSGGYDFVAEHVFGQLAVDGLFLEYDDERSGTFEPLRYVPDDQIVVLGIMTTKTPELESKDTLKRRIDEAAKYVDLDRLCISGQCGFASTVEGNALTIDQERAKLELLVETAAEVWG